MRIKKYDQMRTKKYIQQTHLNSFIYLDIFFGRIIKKM